MIKSFVIACGFIFAFSLIIFYAKYKEELLSVSRKMSAKKRKVLVIIAYTIVLAIVCALLVLQIMKLARNISSYKANAENQLMFNETMRKIDEEDDFYKKSISKEYDSSKAKTPYIPEGFSYVEGEWNTGYVIQNESLDQYVWVPCSNMDEEDIPKLARTDFDDERIIPVKDCYDEDYKEFVESALTNGGFYISRYEMSMENNKLVSKANREVLCGITREEASKLSKDMYLTVKTSLINSFAYDTTLSWFMKNGEIVPEKTIVEENEKLLSGRKVINNIYDFTDNHLEFSEETCYGTVVVRGFSYEDSIENRSRYNILNTDTFLDNYSKIVIRTILYK